MMYIDSNRPDLAPRTRSRRLARCVLAFLLWGAVGAYSQSLDPKNPAPLAEGPNSATVDSFAGMQFWYFTATPGHFHLEFHEGSTDEGFNVGGHATTAIVFAPKQPGSRMTSHQVRGGTVFDGDVTQSQRVVIGIEPANSKLVRHGHCRHLYATGWFERQRRSGRCEISRKWSD